VATSERECHKALARFDREQRLRSGQPHVDHIAPDFKHSTGVVVMLDMQINRHRNILRMRTLRVQHHRRRLRALICQFASDAKLDKSSPIRLIISTRLSAHNRVWTRDLRPAPLFPPARQGNHLEVSTKCSRQVIAMPRSAQEFGHATSGVGWRAASKKGQRPSHRKMAENLDGPADAAPSCSWQCHAGST